jgi:hypothetical protein
VFWVARKVCASCVMLGGGQTAEGIETISLSFWTSGTGIGKVARME